MGNTRDLLQDKAWDSGPTDRSAGWGGSGQGLAVPRESVPSLFQQSSFFPPRLWLPEPSYPVGLPSVFLTT